MVTEEEYKKAIADQETAKNIIEQYTEEKKNALQIKLETNAIFTDDELIYARSALCPCGHGMARPKDVGDVFSWSCSAVLKGIDDKNKKHATSMLSSLYYLKEEVGELTTKGIYIPKEL